MAKFPSIWGDLEVGHVTPASNEPKKEPEKTPETPPASQDPKPEVEPEGNPPVEDPGTAEETPSSNEGGGTEEPEVESLEFSEEEIEKAYNLLIDEGVLPEPEEGDEFDISPAGLADATAAAVRKKLQDEIEAIPESVQQFYAHVMGGNNPEDFRYVGETIWEDVDMTIEGNQEAALMQLYVNQGMTQEDAREEVDDAKAAGKLAKKAGIAQESLAKLQNQQKDVKAKALAKKEKDAADKAKKEIDDIKKTIDDADEIAGFKLDDKKRKAFKDYLFKVNPRTGKTQMQENMANEDRRMNIAFLDFVDYTKEDLTKEIASDLTRKRKKRLTRFSDKGVKSHSSSKTVKTKTNAKKGKVKFPTIFGGQSMEIED